MAYVLINNHEYELNIIEGSTVKSLITVLKSNGYLDPEDFSPPITYDGKEVNIHSKMSEIIRAPNGKCLLKFRSK